VTLHLITRCDVCQIEKKETNHWLRAWVGQDGWLVFAHVRKTSKECEEAIKDICGHACATRILQRWMVSGTLEDNVTEKAKEV
jgi:hypothetical protein